MQIKYRGEREESIRKSDKIVGFSYKHLIKYGNK